MPRKRKITIDADVWVSFVKTIQDERESLAAISQNMDLVYSKQIWKLEATIQKLTRENTLLKNCLCIECRVKRNQRKQIKTEGKGLQL